MQDDTRDPDGLPIRSVLWRLLAPERIRLGGALTVTIAAAAMELMPSALIARSIDMAVSHAMTGDGFRRIAGLIGAVFVSKYLLYSLAYYLSHVAAYGLLADIRRTLVHRLAAAPLTWLQRQSSGHLRKAILQDVERLEQFIAHHTVECLAATASPIVVVLVLAWIDWRLACTALLTVPLAVIAQALLMRGLGPRLDEYNRTIGDLNGATVEYIRNAPVMKTFSQDSRSFLRMRAVLNHYRDLVTAVTRQTVPGWSAFVVLLGAHVIFLLPMGLWLHRRGEIPLGDLILALTLGTGMLRPLFKVAHFSSEIREIGAGLRRIAPILTQGGPSPSPQKRTPRQDQGAVVFEGVSFAYGDRVVLDGISFALRPGEITALVGPSGAGKSTIAHLIGGLVEPGSGEIRIGTIPLSALTDEDRSRRISVVGQETFLFRGTLLDNLRLGRPEASAEMVRRAIRIAQAEDFISALPDREQTCVNERGVRLSGGERQRIAIARSLLCQTPILVLDEATAFADSRTEKRFYRALRENEPDQTVLVIAHRLTAIEHADQILVLENGRLIDAGRHDELMARCRLYGTLWQRQFDSENWSIRSERTAHAVIS